MAIQDNIKTGQDDLRAVSGLFGDALSQAAKLIQNEVDLAKAELTEKPRQSVPQSAFWSAASSSSSPPW